ncbi:NGFI-A-binding protein homolog isoform X1 [Aphis gossypii]|uniref:NGFI-A-binding protein homolog isoform X1 n=1 Tax=Aphis gossypii TaxID=80765 RepID=UPI002159271D|nr:NGFI-A-binding protein homolog isoform X1 [Aphis gossypii]
MEVNESAEVRSTGTPPTNGNGGNGGGNCCGSSPAVGAPVEHSSGTKILSKNSNGTMIMTSSPSNEAELQLYRVMQRASLLAYYDTLLEMGGDDLQQLCDAGEEEFLEIMALVGMASKPLHVRRLQKALHEWVSNPTMFQTPLTSPVASGGPNAIVLPPNPVRPFLNVCPNPLIQTSIHHGYYTPLGYGYQPPTSPSPVPSSTNQLPQVAQTSEATTSAGQHYGDSNSPGQSPGSPLQLSPSLDESQISRLAISAKQLVQRLPQYQPKAQTAKRKANKELECVMNMPEEDPRRIESIRKYSAIYGRFDCKRKPEKPLTLHEVSVNEAAAQICKLVPVLLTRRDELFPLARQVVRDSGYHYSKGHSKSSMQSFRGLTSNGDCSYGSKRPRLDDHDELFKIRRQERLDQIAEELKSVNDRREELDQSTKDDPTVQQQLETLKNRQAQLLVEQNDLRQNKSMMRRDRSGGRTSSSAGFDTDDTDSQMSYSNTSSPLQDISDSRDSMIRCSVDYQHDGKSSQNTGNQSNLSRGDTDDTDEDDGELRHRRHSHSPSAHVNGNRHLVDRFFNDKVQIISSSGGNIIAVTNPALLMSATTTTTPPPLSLKIEPVSPTRDDD